MMLLAIIKCNIFRKSSPKKLYRFSGIVGQFTNTLILNVALMVPIKYLITTYVNKKTFI